MTKAFAKLSQKAAAQGSKTIGMRGGGKERSSKLVARSSQITQESQQKDNFAATSAEPASLTSSFSEVQVSASKLAKQ